MLCVYNNKLHIDLLMLNGFKALLIPGGKFCFSERPEMGLRGKKHNKYIDMYDLFNHV